MQNMLPYLRWARLGWPLLVLMLWTLPASAQTNIADFLTADSPVNLLTNGGFESGNPAYWEATGAGATWATNEARTPGHSLALSGSGEATWTMDEAVRNWVPGVPAGGNPEIVIGAWIKTEGVNTAPASDEDKFQLVFEFFADATQTTNVLGEPVVLDVPQDQASSGDWVELSSETLGAITLPGEQAAKSVRVTFRKGANATGTVYLDDLFLRAADGAEGWAGDWFNANVDAGDTWYYWWDNFSGGVDTWPATQPFIQTVTNEEAHTGQYSLKIEQNDPGASESVAVSDRVPVMPGEPVLVSFWVKTEDVPNPEEIGMANNTIGITALWYGNLEGGAAGWGENGGADIRLNGEFNTQVIPLVEQAASTGWTHYAFVLYPLPEGGAGPTVAMELRLRYWNDFEGTTFWDDVSILPLSSGALSTAIEDADDSVVPQHFLLHQNYPNPFNPTTTITFDLPQASNVTLNVYNLLGQRVATLLDDARLSASRQTVTFDASGLPSGMYLYMLKTNNRTETRRMVLLK